MKVYKTIILYFIIILISTSFFSCEKTFLEKPETSGRIDLDEAYSSAENARATLMKAYRDVLIQGWPGGNSITNALASISGIRARGYSFDKSYSIVTNGLSAQQGTDVYSDNWQAIREAFLVKENIDKVPDIDDKTKEYIKGEALALVAYRYMGMFYRYGGVPIVKRSFLPDDNMEVPRASLQETLNYILELCDEAIEKLPDLWPPEFYGRFTKGAVMAIRARVLQFAARPLFNSTNTPLNLSGHNDMICFGTNDKHRWDSAIAANEAVLQWANKHGYALINTGGAGKGNPNPFENAVHDYGTATSTPGNKEVILAWKVDEPTDMQVRYNASPYNTNQPWETNKVGLLTNFLERYYFRDGTRPTWPQVDASGPTPASDWINKIPRMEARFRVDWVVLGFSSLSNPGDYNWTIGGGWSQRVGCLFFSNEFPQIAASGEGDGSTSKFYYKAGSRTWFEPPLFRLAENYLSLAEAYNEIGNTAKSLENLNIVHNRAGLPSITETDQSELRKLIWNEWALEFQSENLWYFEVKHWKHPDIANGIIGGDFREFQWWTDPINGQEKQSLKAYWDAVTYTGYWHPKMYLEPFPQDEINKGIIIQNPGY